MDTNDGTLSPAARFFANAAPTILSMLLTSGVVLVDGLFVGRFVGSTALASINLTVPVLYGFMAVAIMIAVGGSSQAAPWLGRGDPGEAARIRAASLLTLSSTAVFLSAIVFLARAPLPGLLGARVDTAGYTKGYLSIMCAAYPFSMTSIGLTVFLRGAGDPVSVLENGLAANVLNIALDWLFIVRLGWGVEGAALATAIACVLQCALSFRTAARGGKRLGFARPSFKAGELSGILANGSSEFVGQLSVMISAWAFNRAAVSLYGTPGLAAFTVIGYLAFLESMVVSGCAIGLAPIAGFGWGAGDTEGVREARRVALVTAAALGAVFLGLAVFAGRGMAAAWTGKDVRVVEIASAGFALYALAFPINGYNYLASAFLTALQDAAGSALIAILRGLALPVALILALPRIAGPVGLWLAVPVAEAMTMAAAIPLSHRGLRRLARGFARTGLPTSAAGN